MAFLSLAFSRRALLLATAAFVLAGCSTSAGLSRPAPSKTFQGKLTSLHVVWSAPNEVPYKVSTVAMSSMAPMITAEAREFARRRVTDLVPRLRQSLEPSLVAALGPPVAKGREVTVYISPVQLWVVNGGITLELKVALRPADQTHDWTIFPMINDDAVYKADKSIEQLNTLIVEAVVGVIASEMKKAGWV